VAVGEVAVEVVGVEEGLVEEFADVVVGGRVVDERAFAAAADQAGQAEFRQVLTDCGRCGAGELGQAGD
jgi:hypothetical protein